MVFLCLYGHRREPSIVVQPLSSVRLIVDVVRDFFEVLKVGPEEQGKKRGIVG